MNCGRRALLWSPRFRRNVTGSLARISAEGRRSALAGAWLRSGRQKKDGRQSRDAQRQSEATFTLYAERFLPDWTAFVLGLMGWEATKGGRNATDGGGSDKGRRPRPGP